MVVQYAEPFRITVTDYHRMAELGIIRPDARVELIQGEIVEMNPAGSRHAACVDRLTRLLVRQLEDRVIVRVQNPVHLDETTEPEPDLAVLKFREDFYAGAHPGPADILVVVEVADSSVMYDRNVKAKLYAEAGIPEFWLLDLTRNEVTVYTAPSNGSYAEAVPVRREGTLQSRALGGFTLKVEDVLG